MSRSDVLFAYHALGDEAAGTAPLLEGRSFGRAGVLAAGASPEMLQHLGELLGEAAELATAWDADQVRSGYAAAAAARCACS